jgi:D-alanyl-D-alanine carboxypeptidase/D-alanyl-D-alanine-endopeptidase (penicillin-binding protein 4)
VKRALAGTVLLAFSAAAAPTAGGDRLLYHAEARRPPEVLRSSDADLRFNPASVLKVATSMLALERLAPTGRFVTRFGCRGECVVVGGVINGDLVVLGGGDPDFQPENAWLVARRLNALGINSFSGDLLVANPFWMGWDHGIGGWEADGGRRARDMGGRLVTALDPDRWGAELAAAWQAAADRNGWDVATPPAVGVAGEIGVVVGADIEVRDLVRHRSNPLIVILKRLNTYSNNDIVRIGELVGGAGAVQSYLRSLCSGTEGEIEVATTSGERVNRMTARQVVRLLWAFRDLGVRLGFAPEEVLPVPGCDPGPTPRMFPRLAAGERARTAAIKTGTLSTTDGGVAVLSGLLESRDKGAVAFCVAAPGAGGRLRAWRRAEQEWLLDLMGEVGGADAITCAGPLPHPESLAEVEVEWPPGQDGRDGDRGTSTGGS